MHSRSAITKLKAILLIDVIIVAAAAGIYFYLVNQGLVSVAAKPAEFTVTDLAIAPLMADLGEPISISANLTNIGDLSSNYTLSLVINDLIKENKTIQLAGGVSSIVEFTDMENAEGNYSVKVGNLTGMFTVKAVLPEFSNIILSNLIVSPYEINAGESITIKVTARNSGTDTESLRVRVIVDGILMDSKIVELGAGETTPVEFIVQWTADEGTHKIKVNNLFGGFRVVPVGMHTLSIFLTPVPDEGGADFTINGQTARTPYIELLPEGEYTIAMPIADTTGQHAFLHWEDGSTSPTRRISLTSAMTLTAFYEVATSCPSLYIWNGNSYVYVADVSNHGWLGYMNYITEDPNWPIVYWRNNPWDYIPLDKTQLQTRNGYYDMTLLQKWNEIFYLDAAYMIVVDHPSDVNVYSTMVEQYLDPAYMGKIYTVSKNPLTPISAFNEKGENVLPQISAVDGVFTPGINGLNSPSWDNISWNSLTLDLGDLSSAQEIKLVVRGVVDWGSADDYGVWIEKFFAEPVPNGTQLTPPPYMEVKDENGTWVRVQLDRQFPIPPDSAPRTFVVDLTGLFPTDDYSLRINNFWNVTFDYIGIDTSSQANLTTQRINPYANLYKVFSTGSVASGNFTRYGDVTELVLNEDDMFVIGKQGDEVSLLFPAANLAPPAEGMERDFFFFVALWFKDETGNWGYGFDFTVDPLPFHDMSGFPYPLDTEHYPDDIEHLAYLAEYNTRVITVP